MSDSLSGQDHEKFMKRCLQLASKGLGQTYPNPLVGSVVVYKGRIIGEGWHKKAGGPHAEVNAINSVADTSLLPKATLYVNLEPCSHHGKTPPCADLIISSAIKNVVVGCLDPNPKVAGNGIKKLRAAGCEVTVGVLASEAKWINRRFITSHSKQRPYIILKWAASKDGFLSPAHRDSQSPVWITNKTSRQLVHKWRSEEQAILVGINTVLADNPSLTTRLVAGNSPHRFVIDPTAKVPQDYAVLNNQAPTTILSRVDRPEHIPKNVAWLTTPNSFLGGALDTAYKQKLQSIIIEGGAYTLQRFIENNLWDEARIFTGQIAFNQGVSAPKINGSLIEKQHIDGDVLSVLTPNTENK